MPQTDNYQAGRQRILFFVIMAIMNAIILIFFGLTSFKSDVLMSEAALTMPAVGGAEKEDTNTTALDRRMLKYFQSYSYVPPVTKTFKDVIPAKECGDAPSFEGFFALDSKKRSANNEDKWIYNKLFMGKNNGTIMGNTTGTFVEIGAFNGMEESNTRFFEACLGWEGLLVEGSPINYRGVLRDRPHAHKMSFAPSCGAEYERVNKTVQFSKFPWPNAGLKGYAKSYDRKPNKPHIDVPCGPFTPVLQDVFSNKRINFFSLDVEGAEKRVLDTIDFSKVTIDVMMIEIQNTHCGKVCEVREQVRQKMASEGYIRYERLIPKSDLYIHPKSMYRLPTTFQTAST